MVLFPLLPLRPHFQSQILFDQPVLQYFDAGSTPLLNPDADLTLGSVSSATIPDTCSTARRRLAQQSLNRSRPTRSPGANGRRRTSAHASMAGLRGHDHQSLLGLHGQRRAQQVHPAGPRSFVPFNSTA